jgi:hypothetical protein
MVLELGHVGKFCSVVLEKDGEDQVDRYRVRNKEVLHRFKEERNSHVQ